MARRIQLNSPAIENVLNDPAFEKIAEDYAREKFHEAQAKRVDHFHEIVLAKKKTKKRPVYTIISKFIAIGNGWTIIEDSIVGHKIKAREKEKAKNK